MYYAQGIDSKLLQLLHTYVYTYSFLFNFMQMEILNSEQGIHIYIYI